MNNLSNEELKELADAVRRDMIAHEKLAITDKQFSHCHAYVAHRDKQLLQQISPKHTTKRRCADTCANYAEHATN